MHQPALLNKVLEYLDPCPGKNFIDCTFGFGGHSLALLEKNGPQGKILGIEQDKEVLNKFEKEQQRLILVNDNFKNLKGIVEKYEFNRVNGILLDLGVSSWHFDQSSRGFSFQVDEPLDMRLGDSGLKAEEILNQWSQDELTKIFREYGEERYAYPIAKEICCQRKNRPVKTTRELVEVISRVIPKRYQHGRTHFATRIFQALRIAVNNELDNLKQVLPQALEILEKNGRLTVISFHSLEDRIVKNFFREAAKQELVKILTKKPIIPDEEEIKLNPRSRSAKLRAISKL